MISLREIVFLLSLKKRKIFIIKLILGDDFINNESGEITSSMPF